MNDYRLYFLDSAGHIKRAVVLDFATEEAAVVSADQQAAGAAAELWQRNRLVARFGPGESKAEVI